MSILIYFSGNLILTILYRLAAYTDLQPHYAGDLKPTYNSEFQLLLLELLIEERHLYPMAKKFIIAVPIC
jgi:hypothetical protein